jgi:ABC-type transport system involved in cytochrome c biogenesis ATPase subunit
VLADVTVALRPGEMLRVRGGNGTGKSTLLRLLAGCAHPVRGRVRTGGRVGYLPQLARDLPPLPAGRLSALLGGSDVQVPARPGDPALAPHLGTRADQLSAGSARRLLLDAVLGFPAPVLVLDEPIAGLDAAGVELLAGRLARRLAAGTAVVLAEHAPLPLPGGTVLDLGGTAAPEPLVEIVLAGTGSFRGRPARDGTVTLTVAPAEREALLREALAQHWAVLAVGTLR